MNNHSSLYPLLFQPVLKDYIWGGRNLETILGRELPTGKVAESWEIAAHEDGTSVIINGRFRGQTLTEVHALLGLELIGRNNEWAQKRGIFPLLIKLLDASDKLSVQVHPNDSYALAHEGNELGKSEMWVVLHAEPGAEIILGIRQGVTPDQFHQDIVDGSLEPLLHRVPVSAGDHVCVPSGTLHAILGGILIAEIQQNSNTTYRVYDWNRIQDGKPRPLHIDKAMDVINFDVTEPNLKPQLLLEETESITRSLLCSNQYFTTELVKIRPGGEFNGYLNGDTLEIWGVIAGNIHVNGIYLSAVQFTLLPAALGNYYITAPEGATCLRTYVAKPS